MLGRNNSVKRSQCRSPQENIEESTLECCATQKVCVDGIYENNHQLEGLLVCENSNNRSPNDGKCIQSNDGDKEKASGSWMLASKLVDLKFKVA